MTSTWHPVEVADIEDVTRKIRALLDKAENTQYPAEAEAATSKAAELMARHRITEAMLDATARTTTPTIATRTVTLSRGPYVAARTALLAGIAQAFGCRLVYSTSWEGRVCELLGFDEDLEAVDLLYTSLLVQASVAATAEAVPRGQASVSWRRGFLLGFAETVTQRLSAVMSDMIDEAARATRAPTGANRSSSVEIVLADREARINEEYTRRYGRVGTGRRPSAVLGDAHRRGAMAGSQADLGRTRPVTTSRRSVGRGG